MAGVLRNYHYIVSIYLQVGMPLVMLAVWQDASVGFSKHFASNSNLTPPYMYWQRPASVRTAQLATDIIIVGEYEFLKHYKIHS